MNSLHETNQTILQNRTPLPPGHILQLGSISYEIIRVSGFGSSTIVYEASYKDALIEDSIHCVYVKELYPFMNYTSIERKADGSIQWDSRIDSFMEDQRYFFKKGNEINLSLLEDSPLSISGNLNSYEAHGTYYTIVPIHGGVFLQDLIKNHEIKDLSKCIEIMKQCLYSIKKFHENHLLIMDISPDNILVFPHQAMFIDYNSIWNFMDEEDEFIFSEKEGYTAPEVLFLDLDQIGPWSDLYCACSVFYEMITGKGLNPHDFGHLPQLIQESILLTDTSDNVKQYLLDLFRKGLNPLVKNRYQTCDEFVTDLDELLNLLDDYNNPSKGKFNWKTAVFTIILSTCFVYLLHFICFPIDTGDSQSENSILYQGNSNSNLLNRGRICLAEKEYLYYVDMEGNLRVKDYDGKSEAFPKNNPEKDPVLFSCHNDIEDDSVVFLNLGRDYEGNVNKLYFLYAAGSGHGDSLMSMNLDGSNMEVLLTFEDNQQGDQFTYTMLEDGQEYIYYLMSEIPENEDGLRSYDLCRLDLDTMQSSIILTETTEWFNLYQEYLYYIVYDSDLETSILKRCTLDGTDSFILDETSEFWDGFVEEDKFFLFSFAEDKKSIILCDLDGNIKGEMEHPYNKDFNTLDYDFLYKDQWVYYISHITKEMRRFNISMTSDQLIEKNVDCSKLNCACPFIILY